MYKQHDFKWNKHIVYHLSCILFLISFFEISLDLSIGLNSAICNIGVHTNRVFY